MKPRNYFLTTLICLSILAFVFVTSSCKSNDVSKNREAYEESIGAGGDNGGDNGGDGDDHGDSSSTSTFMSSSDSESGTLTAGDEDWFKVYLSSTGELELYSTGSTDVKVTLYDSSLTFIESDDDDGSGLNFSITRDITSTGYYYIKVEGAYSTTTGSYTVYTSFTADSGGSSSSRYYDFESGVPTDLYNSSDSDASWFVSDNRSYGGSYSLESGDINDYDQSCFHANGSWTSISFYVYTSTEGADDLFFYIDDVKQNSVGYSGISSYWSYKSFTHSPTSSTHVYKWCYEKDYSISTGDDAVWIDNLRLTP